MKRFVPPLLKKKPVLPSTSDDQQQPPTKKPKLEPSASSAASNGLPRVSLNKRKPLLLQRTTKPPPKAPETSSNTLRSVAQPVQGSNEGYYNVLWRKKTNKKHKTFDGDGVLSIVGGYATLQDQSGKDLGKTMMNKILEVGETISVGGKDIEIDSILSKGDFLAGRPFLRAGKAVASEEFTPMPISAPVKSFKTPLLSSTVLPKGNSKTPVPRHDPYAENALVMPRPSYKIPGGKKLVDVVIDPYLSQHLRPHQREGVEFMYQCVMGMRQYEGRGAILADEMGLGKTLQTITLLWTLLKQNPVYGDSPVIKKALIVCPVTLINNWRKEFRKWLGKERIGVFVADSKGNLRDFIAGRSYHICVIGYEKLQRVHTELMKANIDIVIADEGHRLKTEKNKAAQAIKALNTPKKIILSGTPLQNDLHEFYNMVDFVNPGLLESYSTFRKEFENPVLKSRQPGATKKDIEKGEARSKELARITSMFVLRRTAEILAKYLPPKKEYVLYCRPTSRQLNVYRTILNSSAFNRCLGSPDASLLLITVLKKLCNSPGLLDGKGKEQSENVRALLADVDPKLLVSKNASSGGKLRVLDRLLENLKAHTEEKIVIVSNYTSTLDMLQNLLSARGMTYLRLDGSTPSDKRQELVDRFNKVDNNAAFAFLLSAKSGGAGINLIGASRLVLFDLDWNPATDAQAMARIHRDGQMREVKIYRMLTTGCFDEKIFQRQITKQGLADSVMDNKGGSSAFTQAELRDLFSLDEKTDCQTHDLLACPCEGKGYVKTTSAAETPIGDDEEDLPEASDIAMGLMKASEVNDDIISGKAFKAKGGSALGSLMEYDHIDTARLSNIDQDGEDDEGYREVSVEDDMLMKTLCEEGMQRQVSFVFQKT
ncbi:SNF2 family N-terminal domain-containing protein [Geopyxis carbonaria]|nr:SNF2 family N-terminal domain-containing protein [Geopyxis carbonaria]